MRPTTALFALFAGVAAFAQGARPAYDVASVKLTSGGQGNNSHDTDGQLVLTNMSLERLPQRAFGVGPAQIAGPDWLANVMVDVVAKYPPKASDDDRAQMLRTLLEERFKLAVHRENKALPGYAMVSAPKGFKLKPLGKCEQSNNHSGGPVETLRVQCTSMELLAQLLSRYTGQVVQDKTGIEGEYSFDLRWSRQEPKPGSDIAEAPPTLFDALPETLGLRLRPEKVQVEVIVVDHMDRVPVEN